MNLFDWQKPSANRLLEILKGASAALNTSETGTGKTYVAAHAALHLDRPVFVVCPKAVITPWKRVLADASVPSVLDVLNSEKLLGGRTKWFKDNSWHGLDGALVILDEAHKGASGYDSKTTKMLALLKAVPDVKVLIQSATIADSPLKMRMAGYLLGLHHFMLRDFFGWCRRYGCVKSIWHNGLEFPKGKRAVAHMANIHAALKDVSVRIRIADVPEFPSGLVEAKLFDLSKDYTDEINKIYVEMDEAVAKPNTNPLVEMMRARQRTELVKVPLIVDLVKDAVEEGNSVVVFLCFLETMRRISEELAGVCGQVFGGQTLAERDTVIAGFQNNELPVILCQAQAGGVGISLHDVKQERPRVSFLTPSWSATDTLQCLGRIHRAGGTNVVQTFVLAANTVEERVYKAIQRKMTNIGTLNDGDLT